MRTTLSLAVLTAMLAAGPALAQDRGSRQTREFVQAAGQSDNFEILEAETVLAQSQDPQVRSFAQKMMQDHSATKRALQDATARAGLAPPPETIGGDQAMLLGGLQGKKGADFDKTYWQQQLLAHRAALAVTQGYADKGDQPDVRAAAVSATPIISGHLSMVEQMQPPMVDR